MLENIVVALLLQGGIWGQLFQLTKQILENTATNVVGAVNVFVTGCDPINPEQIQYLWYNKLNSTTPVVLTRKNIVEIPFRISTKIAIHGWLASAKTEYTIALKDAYLKRGNYNVILVNWEKHANMTYAQALCGLPAVGSLIGDFIIDLYKIAKIKLLNIHLIGHSLGAHLAGFAGQRVQRQTGGLKIYRITGLDAAGPGFLGFPEDSRLDSSDAYFVDAIHTNGGQFGYPVNYGSVDFYPNCGLFQPGCLDFRVVYNPQLLRQTVENVSCSHNRGIEYFTESINSRKFLAAQFNLCFLRACGNGKRSEVVMGEDCPVAKATGSHCLSTNSRPPYAQG